MWQQQNPEMVKQILGTRRHASIRQFRDAKIASPRIILSLEAVLRGGNQGEKSHCSL